MKSLCTTSLILIFVWQVSCLPVDSSCPHGLASFMRIVLAIDVSASMESQDKLKEVGSVLKEWILSQKPCSVHLGIVQFNLSPRTLNNLTDINDKSRSELVDNIPTLAQGGTCIPCGLKEAIKILGNSNNATDRPIIVLITDAVDSELDLDEDDIMENVEASHAQVVVAVLSNESTVLTHKLNDIEKLTKNTSGFSHYIQNENLQKELMDMLIEMEKLAINDAPTTLPETTEEIAISILISKETILSTVSTTQTPDKGSSTKTTDTPFEDTSIALDNVTIIAVSTASTTSVLNISHSTNTSVTTMEAGGTMVTTVASTIAPVDEKSSQLLYYLGVGAVVVTFLAIFILVLWCKCCRKRNERPCPSQGFYAPIQLRTRPNHVHGDQKLVKHAVRPNSSYS